MSLSLMRTSVHFNLQVRAQYQHPIKIVPIKLQPSSYWKVLILKMYRISPPLPHIQHKWKLVRLKYFLTVSIQLTIFISKHLIIVALRNIFWSKWSWPYTIVSSQRQKLDFIATESKRQFKKFNFCVQKPFCSLYTFFSSCCCRLLEFKLCQQFEKVIRGIYV